MGVFDKYPKIKRRNVKKTTDEFIYDAKSVHGDRYDYSKVEYVNAKTKVNIICKEHGEFETTPNNHLRGKKCVKCSKKEAILKFIQYHRSLRDWNFEQPEDYKLIPLPSGQRVMVDNEDFDRLKDINWQYDNGYAANDIYGRMHRYIMNCPKDKIIDHDNRNRLDNRKQNLIITDHYRNAWNHSPKGGTSKYTGVYWYKDRGRWMAQFTHLKKNYFLGYYELEDEDKAGMAYDLKCLEIRGDYGTLNFPEKKEEYLKIIEDEKKRYTRETSRV